MKKKLLKKFFTLAFITFMIAGWNYASGQANANNAVAGKPSVEANGQDKLKEQVMGIIKNSPKGFQLIEMLNKAGASYMVDLTLPVEKAEKMLTLTSKSIATGFYGVDTKYAAVYNRGDIEMKINKVLIGFFVDLGISDNIDVVNKLIVRIANNRSNKDSVEILTSKAFTEFHKQMASGSHSKVFGLTIMSANVEALYILTQISLYAKDNSKFLELMSNQKERVRSVSKLLEAFSGDETVKPYYESIKPIMKFFDENNNIGNAELKKIAPEIEKLRNSMIK